MTKFGIRTSRPPGRRSTLHHGCRRVCKRPRTCPPMPWHRGPLAACACFDQERRRYSGEVRARRFVRAHRCGCRNRQDRQHSAPLHARILGRSKGFLYHASGAARRPRPLCGRSCCLRCRRDRDAGPRRRRARCCGVRVITRSDRCRTSSQGIGAKNLGRLRDGQRSRYDRVWRQSRGRRRVRQGQARGLGSVGQ